ncbi:MAG: hypothetical protein DDT25_00127 [Chloroflexi bacterium]|nr:hypothetical protein [Chloroflexota bacterium]
MTKPEMSRVEKAKQRFTDTVLPISKTLREAGEKSAPRSRPSRHDDAAYMKAEEARVKARRAATGRAKGGVVCKKAPKKR